MRTHTATHLLHAKLAEIFPNTKQAGSLVESDFLRFDFYADTLLSNTQLKEIENWINQRIYSAFPVTLTQTTFDEAVKLGAKAFFEEKYENEVRLIRVYDNDQCISAELCGGTHVQNTREIWAFTIISQEAVASGIKRISALTGPKVIEKLHNEEAILDAQVQALEVKSYSQLNEKITKFIKEHTETKSKLESIETQMLTQLLKNVEKGKNADFEYIFQLPPETNFKTLPNLLKQQFPTVKSLLTYTPEGNYIIHTDGSISAKSLVQKYQLKGWGSDTVAQGKDAAVMNIH